MSGVTRDMPSGTFLCGHAGWEVLLPYTPLAADSQTGGKLSPQAIFEQGVMEKEWRWQWTTPARRVLKIPHLKVMRVCCLAALNHDHFYLCFLNI